MEITDVDVSLSHGQYFRKRLIMVYIGFAVCCLFPILTVVMLVIPQMEWDALFLGTMICGNIGSMLFLGVLFYVKIKNDRLANMIKLWLEDAVEVKAYSKKIDEKRFGFQPVATKIQVSFTLDNRTYKIDSTYNVFGGYKGYVGCFNKYADREVKIMYSPKYNEVMILKD